MESVDGIRHKRFLHRKLVIVGQGATGKSTLLHAFIKKELGGIYITSVLDSFETDDFPDIKDVRLHMTMIDTPGQEDYDRLRPLSYPDTDVFLMCFGLDNYDTYELISEKWVPEVRHYCPRTPILLVGTKSDLSTCPKTKAEQLKMKIKFVSAEDGMKLADSIGAAGYIECSSKTMEGVQEVFNRAAQLAIEPKKKKCRGACCLLL